MKTTTKPATKTSATKPAAKKPATKPAVKEPVRGTVGWLIEELKKFPKDMHVLHGDLDSNYYDVLSVEVLPILDGNIDRKRGENIACITAW